MNKSEIIQNTITFVKETLNGAESGHDWFHINRVYKMAMKIAKTENVDLFVVELAALLHDIADSKFHNGDETVGPKKAMAFLETQQVSATVTTHIINIIANMSFSKSLDQTKKFNSLELQVVQDADRIDAIGAIGIARAFAYGGYKNRLIYDPKVKPVLNFTKAAYKKSTAPTINHFYEKLLLLKDKMNTTSAKKIAIQRHEFMVSYLNQFFDEWDVV